MTDVPDVLWLSLESVRADHTPMYGYDRETTPTVAAIADRPDATRLDNGVAASLWTPAASASMLTGTRLSTHMVGADGSADERLPTALQTLPELLSDVGYDTALFTPNPYVSEATGLDRGFDHTTSVNAVPSSYSPLNSDAATYWRAGLERLLRSRMLDVDRAKKELKTTENEVLATHAERWLSSVGSRDGPFFTYAHLPGPHHPYLPNADYLDRFTDDIAMSAEEAYDLVVDIYYGGSESITRHTATGLDLTPREWAGIEAMYDATLRHMDDTVERILSSARAASDDLVVVIVGDHGELFGELGLIGHNLALHEAVLDVPMVVSGLSGVVTDEDELTQQIDLTYTVADRVGVSTDGFEGRDIRTGGRSHAISQYGHADFDAYAAYDEGFDTARFFERPHTAVRSEGLKLLTDGDRVDLYDLPDEKRDVSADRPEAVDRLLSVYEQAGVDWSGDAAGDRSEFSDAQMEQLADLGYL